MPEGDTIRRLAERINQRLAGQRVVQCITRDPRLVGVDLTGTTLLGADAVGKHLFVRFDDGRTLHAHLRMDGKFVVGPVAKEVPYRRRLELTLTSGRLTAVDVPILAVIPTSGEHDVVGHLGPDLCAADLPDLDEVVDRLQRHVDAPLAGALLDQRNVAGLGNVFAVEVPFLVGVSPNQPIGGISGLRHVVEVATGLIRYSSAKGPRNTTGRNLRRPEHWVYGKRAGSCPLCGTRLDGWDEVDSPWRRQSVWCPSCQALGADVAADAARAHKLLALHPALRLIRSLATPS